MTSSILKRKVAIIGCGPVGALGSLLLQHLGIDTITLQRHQTSRSHPSAHWLTSNSKTILSQIPNLAEQIDSRQQNWEYFRRYRYVQHLFGHQLGVTDHFQSNVQKKLETSRALFGEGPNHIPQSLLLEILCKSIEESRVMFGKDIKRIGTVSQLNNLNKDQKKQDQQNSSDGYVLYDQNNQPVVQSQYIILCSGINSHLKNSIHKFHTEGNHNLMEIINIHFTSKKLAQKLTSQNHNAMLHFIYSRKLISILVNHSIQKGEFVLQIPNFEPFVDLLQLYSARELIQMIFSDQAQSQDMMRNLNVINVGKWRLQGVLADSMYRNGIFLAGDAAHAYPPAGGFGMNSGFQDIHQLVHSIYMAEKNNKVNKNKIFEQYSQNRSKVNSQYLNKAMQNYHITKNVSTTLGYPPNMLDYFSKSSIVNSLISYLPKSRTAYLEQLRLQAMKLMYRRRTLGDPGLHLFFDKFDQQIQNLSQIRNTIMKDVRKQGNRSPCLYAREGDITMEHIQAKVGMVDQENVRFYRADMEGFKGGEKLIHSNGNVLIK